MQTSLQRTLVIDLKPYIYVEVGAGFKMGGVIFVGDHHRYYV